MARVREIMTEIMVNYPKLGELNEDRLNTMCYS